MHRGRHNNSQSLNEEGVGCSMVYAWQSVISHPRFSLFLLKRTQQQHECCTPGQVDYAVREWVCIAGTYRYATAYAANQKSKKPWPPSLRHVSTYDSHLVER